MIDIIGIIADWPFWVGLWSGSAGGFAVAVLLRGRADDYEARWPTTIVIPPIADDEPVGDVVDIKRLISKWEDE